MVVRVKGIIQEKKHTSVIGVSDGSVASVPVLETLER